MRLTSGSIKATSWSQRCRAVRRRMGVIWRVVVRWGARASSSEQERQWWLGFSALKPNEGGKKEEGMGG
jgi:hypothetical protein